MLGKEKKQHYDYYKNYKRVILFGPNEVKIELFELLSKDKRNLKNQAY